jgi:hypothetical protein
MLSIHDFIVSDTKLLLECPIMAKIHQIKTAEEKMELIEYI